MKLNASSTARRVACPGSHAMENATVKEREESPYTRDGILAHDIANQLLIRGQHVWDAEFSGYDDEILESALLYQNHVLSILNRYPHCDMSTSFFVEKNFEIGQMSGRPDCFFIDKETGDLHIWEYKYGHSPVEVFENWSLIAYTYLIINSDLSYASVNNIFFHVVQPRSFHKDGKIRTWKTKISLLIPYFDKLEKANELSLNADAPCRPSIECNFCEARNICVALQKTSLQVSETVLSINKWDLSATEAGHELKFLKEAAKLLDARISGLTEQVISMIQRGDRVPNFQIEHGAGRIVWGIPKDQVASMGDVFEIDLRKPVDVITPLQAIKNGIPEDLINSCTTKTLGAIKLVENTSEARKIFIDNNRDNGEN